MKQTTNSLHHGAGRRAEIERLRTALRKRESQLIWGATDAGKTWLIENALLELPDAERKKCICWSGAASRRQLIEHLLRRLYLVDDPHVRKTVQAERVNEAGLNRWIGEQSVLRLRAILFAAAEQGQYRFFIDHLPAASRTMAQLMKELSYRTKTPVYLTGQGYSQGEIGFAWSLYWTDEHRIHLGPLPEASARELLEESIERFGLGSHDLEGFRDEVLHLSGRLPGSIVKMCELASDRRYHYGTQIKIKLVHVDYLLHGSRFSPSSPLPGGMS
jgi:hypothetical protein